MAINNVSQMASTLKNYNVDNWSKSIELGNKFDYRGDFPELNETGNSKSFGDFLADSISKVNKLQIDADVATQKLASGESKNIHETLLAVKKAELAFKQMNQVRTKVIDAYKEIMRMQV